MSTVATRQMAPSDTPRQATLHSGFYGLIAQLLVTPSLLFAARAILVRHPPQGLGTMVHNGDLRTVQVLMACTCSLSCCVYCFFTIAMGTFGTSLPSRLSLMRTVLSAALSCALVNVCSVVELCDGLWPREGLPLHAVVGNAMQLIYWLVFSRQAGDYVAERMDNSDAAPHLSHPWLAARGWVFNLLAACLAVCSQLYPRGEPGEAGSRTRHMALLSVGTNAFGDAVVVYQFQTAWRILYSVAASPDIGPRSKSLVSVYPTIIGTLLLSLSLPMAYNALWHTPLAMHVEQMWQIVHMPVRLLGMIICFLAVSSSADEHKQEVQQLALARADLRVQREVNAHKAQYIRYVLHGLRNPMNTLQLCLSELSEGLPSLPPWVATLCPVMQRACEDMKVHVDQGLDMAAFNATNLRLSLEPANVVQVAQLCVGHMRPFAESLGVRLRLLPLPGEGADAGPGEGTGEEDSRDTSMGSGWFLLDKVRFMQVLSILIINACRCNSQESGANVDVIVHLAVHEWSTHKEQEGLQGQGEGQEGRPDPAVPTESDSWVGDYRVYCPASRSTVGKPCAASCDPSSPLKPTSLARPSATRTGRIAMLRLTVCDMGPGVGPADLPLLLRLFTQAERSLAHTGGEVAGLGLAICKEIVAKHGGCLGVGSVVGQGCDFWCTLPLWEVLGADEGHGQWQGGGIGLQADQKPADQQQHDREGGGDQPVPFVGGQLPVEVKGGTPLAACGHKGVGGQQGAGEPSSEASIPSTPTPTPTPSAYSQTASAGEQQGQQVVAAPGQQVVAAPGQSTLRILLVEDVATIRKLMKRQLSSKLPALCPSYGLPRVAVEVDEAGDGQQGVQAVLAALGQGRPYHVVLLDKEMPVMDGYEAVRQIRRVLAQQEAVTAGSGSDEGHGRGQGHALAQEVQGKADCLIVGVTGNALLSDQEEFLRQGLDCLLTKPVDVTALAHKILTWWARGAVAPAPKLEGDGKAEGTPVGKVQQP